MSKRYTSGVISSSLPTVNAGGASGVFTLNQQADYQSRNSWPPFKVEESLRFRSSASAYLNRTFSASNRRTFTFSAWVKRGSLTGNQNIFGPNTSTSGSGTYGVFRFVDGSIEFFDYTNGTHNAYFYTSSSQYTFRDPSAWYHLVLAVDTTQATGSNRIKVYVNGTQITGTFYTTPTLNYDLQWNNNLTHYLGTAQIGGSNQYFDGYLAEVNFIDGQQLTPSSFGATDKDGNWSPIAYTGTYGTNGFYVNFRDNTSATTVGYDYSGNGNNWTLNGFNVSTANTSYDIMIDVPQDQSDGTANNRGNYCTLNPIDAYDNAPTQGNLARIGVGHSGSPWSTCRSTLGVSSGKWYFEATLTGSSGSYQPNSMVGIMTAATSTLGDAYGGSTSRSYQANGGLQGDNSTGSVSSAVSGDVIMCAFDIDAGKVWFGKNDNWFNSGVPASGTGNVFTSVPTSPVVPAIHMYGNTGDNNGWYLNFGQRPFAYTPPSGFKALNTYNLPEPIIKQPNKYFDIKTRTGADGATPVTGINFQPDFVWVKGRNVSVDHALFDAVRGTAKTLYSSATNAETSNDIYGYLSAFNSGGYSFTSGSTNIARVDSSSYTYVDWLWNAGGSNATNTSGTITSTVRANQTAGFSIVTYTANATDPITVGHGLGVAPNMFIVKSRSAAGTDWFVYHSSLGATKNLRLNGTAAAATATNVWNDTAPTSSVITTSNAINTNNVTYVAYCFAAVAGYSAFGSYTGNGSSDGPFVYLGFRPKYFLIKRTDTIGNWTIRDSSRVTYNPNGLGLFANLNIGDDSTSGRDLDLLSNGFKVRGTDTDINASGGTYIYAAFAEAPFKYARSR